MTYTRTFVIPWKSPPLTANQRLHWAAKAKLSRQIRDHAALIARDVPFMDRVDVRLTWVVTTKHRRDVDNVYPTYKALCDGLVDADVVPDDTPDLMVKHIPTIIYDPEQTAHFELTLTELKEN